VVVGQTAGMHQQPAETTLDYAAVVPEEPRATALVVNARLIQRYVDGVRRSVVVGSQTVLLIGPIAHQEVHDCLALRVVALEHFAVVGDDELTQEVEPLLLKADLSHVYVDRWDVLVPSCQSRVVILPCNNTVLLLTPELATTEKSF